MLLLFTVTGLSSLSSANLSSQQQPYHFEYDVPPQQSTKYEEEPPEVTFRSQQKLDAIRKVQLGICPAISLKQCTRCSCMSALSIGVRSPATRWWDQHWVKSCLCGGHWRSSN
ncbi:PREDICTED: mediator of RNA polymerase II transcription subunit 16-like [Priapulus caudatus]|uniref:Mediator of RNA polymerase II transcription subunit 16-like n=1 Tax=Priapulus caudatus TaxID=37621 RepID=A0ABM1ELQ7_PRICU|nr:PREDICTED: mediator of RNA polymerase II transcription subunit 16-like [Priapulus caudatus]